MVVHVDRALVLARHPFSESSLVVHVLTPGSGRVDLLAKGAYRPTSRYYAVLDLFDTLELEWDASPTRDLETLRRGSLLVRRRGVGADLARYRAGLTILELLELVVRPGVADPELFAQAERALDRLAAPNRGAAAPGVGWEPTSAAGEWNPSPDELEPVATAFDPALVQVQFELALLDHLGLAPALDRCAACGRSAPKTSTGRVSFSAGAGGRLCTTCARDARASGRRVGTLPVSVLDDARRLWHDSDSRVTLGPGVALGSRVTLGPAELVRVRDFVERFLVFHLETLPRSQAAFLSVHNRNAPTAATSDGERSR